MAKSVGSIIIDLGLNSTKFNSGLSDASKNMNKSFGRMTRDMKVLKSVGDEMGVLETKAKDMGRTFEKQQNISEKWSKKLENSKTVLKNLGTEQEASKQKIERLNKAYEESVKATGKSSEESKKLAKMRDSEIKNHEKLSAEIEKAGKTQDQYAKNAEHAGKMTEAYGKQLSQAEKDLKTFKLSQEGVAKQFDVMGNKLKDISSKTGKWGSSLTKKVSVPIAGAFGYAIKQASEWEDAFAGVKKTVDEVEVDGKVTYSYKQLGKELQDMSTRIPMTTTELAAIAENAGQLGVKTEDIIGFTETMAMMGESTNLSSEEASMSLAKMMNIMGTAPENVSRLGATIVELGNTTSTAEKDIMEMAMRVSGTGNLVGMTEEQVLGLSAALSGVGINAEAGGSSISRTLQMMYSSVISGTKGESFVGKLAEDLGMTEHQLSRVVAKGGKPLKQLADSMDMTTKEFKDMYKEADGAAGKLSSFAEVSGVTSEEFVKTWEKNPSEALMQFVGGLGKMKEEGLDVTGILGGMDIKSVQMVDTLLRASGGQEKFAEALTSSKKGWEENTALVEEAEKRHATLSSQLEFMKNRLKVIAQNVGGPLVKAVNSALDAIKPFLDKIIDLSRWFSDADKGTQQFILSVAGILIVLGPILTLVSKITGAMSGLAFIMKESAIASGLAGKAVGIFGKTGKLAGLAMGVLTSPITWIIGGLALLTVALVLAYKKFEPFRNIVDKTALAVKDFAINAIGKLKEMFDKYLGPAVDFFKEKFGQIKQFIVDHSDEVKQAVKDMIDKIKEVFNTVLGPVIDFFKKKFGQIKEFITAEGPQVKEAVNNIVEGIKWVFDHTLGPIIEFFKTKFREIDVYLYIHSSDVRDTFKTMWEKVTEIFHSAIEFIKPIVETGFKVIKFIIEKAMLVIKFVIEEVWNTITGLIDGALKVIGGLVKVFSGLFTGDFSKMWQGVKDIFFGAIQVVWNYMQLLFFGKLLKGVAGFVGLFKAPLKAMWVAVKGFFSGGAKGVTGIMSGTKNVLTSIVSGIAKVFKTIFSGMWSAVKTIFSAGWSVIKAVMTTFKNVVVGIVRTIYNGYVKIFTTMWNIVKDLFKGNTNTIRNVMGSFKNILKAIVTAIKDFYVSIFKGMWNTVKRIFDLGLEFIKRITSNAWNSMKNGVRNFKDGFVDIIKKMIKSVKSHFNGMVDWVKKVPQRMADGLAKGAEALKTGAKKMGNGMIGGVEWAVNHTVGAVNWVLDKVGSDKKLDKWEAPKFAKGTPMGGHDGGIAHIGDGGKRELVHLPNGQMFLSPNKDTVVNLPKGTEVVSGPKTERLFGGNVPKYAKGSGGFFSKALDFGASMWNKTKEFSKGAFNKVKDWSVDIWDWVADKASIGNLLVHKIGDKLPENPLGLAYDVMKGTIKKSIDAAKDFIFGESESMGGIGAGGSFGGEKAGSGSTVAYKYLHDIFNAANKKFGNLRPTSGYRPGDPYSHGRYQALDIAHPSAMNGSARNKEVADWIYNKYKSQVAYVITNGKVRDRSGMSGQPATGNWRAWPDNDHYDHIHINGMFGPGDVYSGGSGGKVLSGGGVERWRGQVKKALKMNGLPTANAYVNAWMKQIDTESKGNPSAIGGNDNIVAEGNATGLLQVKPPTFNAHKHKGHGNIMNGFDNMLAAMAYAKSKYGFQGMLQVIGHGHGYANGGIITKDQIARVGEGNKPEMVVPLTRKTRAIALMQQAQDMMGIGPNSDNTVVGIMQAQNDKIDKLIEIVQYMALNSDKQQPIIVNGNRVDTQEISEDLATLSQRGRFNLGG